VGREYMKTANIYGYMGKIAVIDLTKSKVIYRSIDLTDARLFIGGSGLCAKLLYDLANPQIDAFNPENPLIIMTGPMTGTPFPTSGRFAACSKSPLTNILGEATASGFWGPALKFAGLDGLIITGKAQKPVYLYIDEGGINICDAGHLWGLGTHITVDIIRKDHGDSNIRVLSIGPAGEKLVCFASIMTDDDRSLARTGLGAVMGSKNLKAIAVRGGAKKPEIAKPDKLIEIVKQVNEILRESPGAKRLNMYGTASLVEICEALGDLPIRNWAKGSWPEGAKRISGETMAKTILRERKTCFACPIACGRIVEVPINSSKKRIKGPEYETLAMLGSLLLIDSLEVIAKANYLCNDYGMDTISTGSVIAFAIEAYEKGYITKSNTGGLELKWGDAETLLALIDRIARREGIGDLLAEGVKRAAEKIGKGAEEFAVHVKGLEVPAHDPRAFASLALQYATMPRGACHTAFAYIIERGLKIPELGLDKSWDRFTVEGKAELVKTMQDYILVFDSLALCKFLVHSGVPPSLIVEGLSAITGWDISLKELLLIGERIFNIKRLFNVRCGIRSEHDALPKRLQTPLTDGAAKGKVPNLNHMLKEYYRLRGWDENGIPTKEKLAELGLLHLIKAEVVYGGKDNF
jgi:aldehyde:ferredoxin oxidoreductase